MYNKISENAGYNEKKEVKTLSDAEKTYNALEKILKDKKSLAGKSKNINVGFFKGVENSYVALLMNPVNKETLKVRFNDGKVEVSQKTNEGKEINVKLTANVQKNAVKKVMEAIENFNPASV